jgi:hypothetical protein
LASVLSIADGGIEVLWNNHLEEDDEEHVDDEFEE